LRISSGTASGTSWPSWSPPNLVEPAKDWDCLSEFDRGVLIGKIVGEIGATVGGGIIAGKILAKVSKARKAAKAAAAAKGLEGAARYGEDFIGPIPLDLSGAGDVGLGVAARGGKWTKEVIERKTLGADGASSRHIIEKLDGKTNSVTHQVTKDGQVIHQHQMHIGKYGTERQFPDKWVEYPRVTGGEQ